MKIEEELAYRLAETVQYTKSFKQTLSKEELAGLDQDMILLLEQMR